MKQKYVKIQSIGKIICFKDLDYIVLFKQHVFVTLASFVTLSMALSITGLGIDQLGNPSTKLCEIILLKVASPSRVLHLTKIIVAVYVNKTMFQLSRYGNKL